VCAKYTQLLVFSSTLLWFYFLGFLGFALFSFVGEVAWAEDRYEGMGR